MTVVTARTNLSSGLYAELSFGWIWKTRCWNNLQSAVWQVEQLRDECYSL